MLRPGAPGELLLAVGAIGVESTVAKIVDTPEEHGPNVAITEYMPVAGVYAGFITGLVSNDVKPFGPVQL
jgi:hypothetical protein